MSESSAWAADLRAPKAATRPIDIKLAEAPKTFLQKAYQGNLQNFGIAMTATGVSCAANAVAVSIASAFGADNAACALIGWAATYTWYPVYFALNHHVRDRAVVKALSEGGDSGSRMRMWGSRLTQGVAGEVLWFAAMVPGQILLRKFGLGAAGAAVAAHIPASLFASLVYVTPIRNISQMLWRVDDNAAREAKSRTGGAGG